MMDLDSFLVSLYVLVDDWWKAKHSSEPPRVGRPALLADSEVITLAILAQWPRFRSERDFWRFARAHLSSYFPTLCSQSQFNRRVRALEPELRDLQRGVSETLCGASALYHVLDTTLIPAIARVRASRKGLFAGQATFGRCASKTEWVYGFKVALSVSPEGVIRAFGLAEAASDERPIGEFLIVEDSHDAYLADKGFAGVEWERRWSDLYGALVVATPKDNSKRAWTKADRRWASGKRQIIEGVIDQLKDLFGLERHRAKTLEGLLGLLARLAAKIAAYTCGQWINERTGRPLRHLADLLV
jgi:Transposase DDE domain